MRRRWGGVRQGKWGGNAMRASACEPGMLTRKPPLGLHWEHLDSTLVPLSGPRFCASTPWRGCEGGGGNGGRQRTP